MSDKVHSVLDFETYYDKDYSLRKMSPQRMALDDRFDPYLLSIVSDDGFRWVGHPQEAPWEHIEDHTWISHNRSYDLGVWERLVDMGKIPDLPPERWECTADMCAYLQLPRALDAACFHGLEREVSKSVRDDEMKGVKFHTLPDERKRVWEDYALSDGDNSLDLWKEFSEDWPQWERDISMHTNLAGQSGVHVNVDLLMDSMDELEEILFDLKEQIPWSKDTKILSPKAVREECQKIGIPPPRSMAQSSEVFDKWLDNYADQAPWATAMGEFRQAAKLFKALEEIDGRLESEDGLMKFGLKYFGAQATGRWSGTGGLNMQNLTKKPRFEINLRHMFVPGPGKKFVIVDLSQIEPRCLAYLAGDWDFLSIVATGVDCYEASARATGRYSDPRPMKEVEPILRDFYKARVLGAGYGIGPTAYLQFARSMGLDMDMKTAKREIAAFRRENPKIVQLWKKLDREINIAAVRNEDWYYELPSGREIGYFNCAMEKGKARASTCVDDSRRVPFWGAKLVENITQAMARDVFCHGILDIVRKGIPFIWHVHDELICEVDASDAEEALKEIQESLSITPDWCENLPLAAEGSILDMYDK